MPHHEAYVFDMANKDQLKGDEKYEVQMEHFFAISKDTRNSDFVMDYTVIPIGSVSRAHCHINSALSQYFIMGEGYYLCGFNKEVLFPSRRLHLCSP